MFRHNESQCRFFTITQRLETLRFGRMSQTIRKSNFRSHIFYTATALALAVSVFVGFSRTYYLKSVFGTEGAAIAQSDAYSWRCVHFVDLVFCWPDAVGIGRSYRRSSPHWLGRICVRSRYSGLGRHNDVSRCANRLRKWKAAHGVIADQRTDRLGSVLLLLRFRADSSS